MIGMFIWPLNTRAGELTMPCQGFFERAANRFKTCRILKETHMSKILMFTVGLAITTVVSAAQFSVDLWGTTYIADKDTVTDSVFRLDDNGCRKEVTAMVYADAAKGVENKPAWTTAYLDCMQGKGYTMTKTSD